MLAMPALAVATLVVVSVVVSATSHRPTVSSVAGRFDEDSTTSSRPHFGHDGGYPSRHPLRHHGQDYGRHGVSPLDRLLNRLDSPSYYWRGGEDRDRDDNLIARDALRRAVEDYERGAAGSARTRKTGAEFAPAPTPTSKEVDLSDEATDGPKREVSVKDPSEEEGESEGGDSSDEQDIDSSDEDFKDDSDEFDEDDEVEDMMVDDTWDTSKNHMSEALSDSPQYTSHSEDKWREYGNRERLEYNRRHHNPRFQMSTRLVTETTEHLKWMGREGACRVPRPQVIKVQDVYPDPSKVYMPHCTILHQCGDSSGCCRTETETCKPKPFTEQKISLPFYTTRVGRSEPIVETLEFYNHTECECVRRLAEGRRQHAHAGHPAQLLDSSPAARKQRQARNMQDMPRHIQLTPHHLPGCRCPSAYSPREMNKGCTCDCFDRQMDCLHFKRGKGYFSLEDRLCIQTEQCKHPECEFGTYMKLSGRCPRRDEKFYYRRP